RRRMGIDRGCRSSLRTQLQLSRNTLTLNYLAGQVRFSADRPGEVWAGAAGPAFAGTQLNFLQMWHLRCDAEFADWTEEGARNLHARLCRLPRLWKILHG